MQMIFTGRREYNIYFVDEKSRRHLTSSVIRLSHYQACFLYLNITIVRKNQRFWQSTNVAGRL